MLSIQRKISPYNHYDYNNPEYIVIHYIGATGTARNNADYFYSGDRQASAHFYIGETECWQGTEIYNGSWAVGNTRTEVNNQNSINIEMECANPQLFVTDKTIQNTCELVAYLMKQYNIPLSKVRSHYEVSGKTKICPNFANTSRWTEMKNKIQAEYNKLTQPIEQVKPSSDIIYRVKLANGEQIGAFRSLDSAKSLAQINKCNVYRSTDNVLVVSYIANPNVANKTINYRVKRVNGEQLGAFNSLDNAKILASENKAIVYDASGKVVISYVPQSTSKKYVNLKSHMTGWNVYPLNKQPIIGNQCGKLNPSLGRPSGGLSYTVLEEKGSNVYVINTSTYGKVQIYCPNDNDGSVGTKALYEFVN